jgi:hypothetical protein
MGESDVKETVTDLLNGLKADFSDGGTIQLMQCLHKCLNHNGDYVEE